MSFIPASDSSFDERAQKRRGLRSRLLRFGVSYLDDATGGIFPSDLILLGAPSGFGKTQLCCLIALANLEDGKKVHYIALEADQYEIEQRLKYQLFIANYLADANRPLLDERISFRKWYVGDYDETLKVYEDFADKLFSEAYKDLFLFYKQGDFNIVDLIEQVSANADKTDLIIVDHVHYFDLDDDNENRAMKQIAKTSRTLALDENKPIILVSHLRKRDKDINGALVADMEEFHGSSDLFKIATKVITMASGGMSEQGTYETYFRVPKNRIDGGVNRFIGRTFFDPRMGSYEKKYEVGWATQTRRNGFMEVEAGFYPDWAKQPALGSSSDSDIQRVAAIVKPQGRTNYAERVLRKDFGDDV